MALTRKQQIFVDEYLTDLNATAAYRRAGYSAKGNSAEVNANRLLRTAKVAAAVQDGMDKRSQRTAITADYVLEGIQEVAERCMQRAPVMEGRGEDRRQMTDDEGRHVWSFDATGANKAFENLGKHLKLFTDKIEHSGSVEVAAKEQRDAAVAAATRADT